MTKPLLILALALGLAASRTPAEPLPPDLQMQIADIHTETTESGEKVLYFSSYTVNRGAGPIELHCLPEVNGTRDVYQRIFDSDGTSYTDTFVGSYAVIDGRIRFVDSADYFLREVNEDDSVGAMLGSRQKVAYCLVDSHRVPDPPPGSPTRAVYGRVHPPCGNVLGISVGWVDNYYYTIPNQNIDLTGISSGTYWLQNIIDPLQKLVESNESNNQTHVKVTVTTSYSPEVALLGNGVAIANNETMPASTNGTDFGYVEIGSGSVTRTFTIENNGSGTLSLTGVPRVKISGSSDFAVVTQPSSPVVAGGSTTFQVSFNPSGMNAAAELSIVNNDSDETPYRFTIRGNANAGNPDADNDGMPDDWEALYNVSDPAADEDGDGATNLDEFIAGNSPRDASSVFRFKETKRVEDGCELTWDSVKGRTYKLYSNTDLSGLNPWLFIAEWPGTGAPITATVPPPNDGPQFYRLTVGF